MASQATPSKPPQLEHLEKAPFWDESLALEVKNLG